MSLINRNPPALAVGRFKSCKDCLHCKVNISKNTIRCNPGVDQSGNPMGHWILEKGGEHIFSIYPQEFVTAQEKNEFGRKTFWEKLKLAHRKVFDRADTCEDFVGV